MTAYFMVRAQVVDATVRNDFDRLWDGKVTRSRDFVEVIQAVGG